MLDVTYSIINMKAIRIYISKVEAIKSESSNTVRLIDACTDSQLGACTFSSETSLINYFYGKF